MGFAHEICQSVSESEISQSVSKSDHKPSFSRAKPTLRFGCLHR
ncbi:hypothetical protein NEISICOT_03598 [Neisseria sicca ATCC 29256]|uniref:Uncharacterized protein n=1 Tax=Neisseria sicca ATCC 29256 TaxID=547045 RepID=C6MAL6_NEISI|nr:hypothetical protein NEISICOT_03598 [Neisseria sicca ATCC 29256]